jgi:hypothetical protein
MNAESIAKVKDLSAKLGQSGITYQRQNEIMSEIGDLVADDLKMEAETIVKDINSSIMTTKDHYGRYMQVLSHFKGVWKLAMVKALRRAGAGAGLEWALRVS